MNDQDFSWNIFEPRLAILAASVFQISCRKQSDKRR